MSLTEEQQRFLARYINNRGDFYNTIGAMGLDLAHIATWQQVSPEFDRHFRETKKIVLLNLKEENQLMALLKINDALKNGITHHAVREKHSVDASGESTFSVIRETKHMGVPGWAITESLKESSLVKAIETLSAEGVLPAPVAKRLLQVSDKITDEIRASFDIGSDNEFISEKKAVALIKQAILGIDED